MSLILKGFLDFQESSVNLSHCLRIDYRVECAVNKRDEKCGLQNRPSGDASQNAQPNHSLADICKFVSFG